jgi:DNA repair protein RadC
MAETAGKLSIKYWSESDRPREKLLAKGKQSLSDAELIAVIIGSGSPEESAVELSRKILGKAENDLRELGKFSVKELMKFRGIGEAKAIGIVAAIELGRRRQDSEGRSRKKIETSRDVAEIFQPLIGELQHEEFWVLYLNRANSITEKINISRGGVTGTVVDVKLIFKPAVENLSSSIILCHNHPSGNCKPSEADIRLTRRLREAGTLFEISVLDHVIVTEKAFYSFADEGVF